MKLIIDRSRWLRGEGANFSKLLRKQDGKMCCLGQFALSCGLEEEDIFEISAPRGIKRELPSPMQFLLKVNSQSLYASGPLMQINDDLSISDEEREAKLTQEFSTHGIEVEFVN